MPEVKFGKKDEPSTVFQKSDDLIAVRTRSTQSLLDGPVLRAAAAELRDGQLQLAFPEAGVEVYRVPVGSGHKSVQERSRALQAAPDVRFAGGVLLDELSQEPVVYTKNLFLKFIDSVDANQCRDVIRQHGLSAKRELTYATNAFFVAAMEGTGIQVFDIALELLKRDDVEYCHPEVLRKRQFRTVFSQQWHLKSTDFSGTRINASANVEAAHQTTCGHGVVIAIIDDGFDIDHPDFGRSNKVVAPWDATLGSDDPRPKDPSPFEPEDHGTACAGVSCADGVNGACGVAPDAKLMPIRLSSGLGSQEEADAFRWAADQGADVISCSWGPRDGLWFDPQDPLHNQVVALPAMTKLAIDYATTNGRGGKGCVILFAAGNGRESVDNDGYASYERVIAVAACNDRGKRSVYSDFGAAVWCAFPSSDRESAALGQPAPLTPGIWTTDRVGSRGYNSGNPARGDALGNYTNSFGGTSSSCPGAAGIAALVLSVNPDLQLHEVRGILGRACDKIDPQGGLYDVNGRSQLYSFGRLNAETAVQLAQPQPRGSVAIVRSLHELLADRQPTRVSLEVGEAQPIDSLAVQIEIVRSDVSGLDITLTPPPTLKMADVHFGAQVGRPNLKQSFTAVTTPALAAFRGKSVQGEWALQVQEAGARNPGALIKFGLELALPAATRIPAATIDGEPGPIADHRHIADSISR